MCRWHSDGHTPSARSWRGSKKAASISLTRAARKRSPDSLPEGFESRRVVERNRLPQRLTLLWRRSVQKLDQCIDRVSLRQIDSALESGLDQAADDLGSTDCLAVLQSDVDGKTIEIGDMAVQKDHRNFRPGLCVDDGSTTVAFYRAHAHSYFRTNC
ncbi:MAG: hypothetical protein ACXVJT_09015 [Thermoanaerobaculia bacterium]